MNAKQNNLQFIDKIVDKHKRLIFGCLVVVVLILLDFAPLIGGGNIRTYTKWAECGQRPVREALSFAGGVRHYEEVPIFQLTGFMTIGDNMYCTALDAEKAGLSASNLQYQYPHLDAEKNK